MDVTADLAQVQVRHAGRLVATHDRVWARGMTTTDPAHVVAAKVLREQYQQPRPARDADDPLNQHGYLDDLNRDLAEYDHAFGLRDPMPSPFTPGEVA